MGGVIYHHVFQIACTLKKKGCIEVWWFSSLQLCLFPETALQLINQVAVTAVNLRIISLISIMIHHTHRVFPIQSYHIGRSSACQKTGQKQTHSRRWIRGWLSRRLWYRLSGRGPVKAPVKSTTRGGCPVICSCQYEKRSVKHPDVSFFSKWPEKIRCLWDLH